MEAPPQRSIGESRDRPVVHQVPDRKNKIERITDQTKGLFQDFTQWVELRLKLFQFDIQSKLQKMAGEALVKVAPFVSGAIAGFFALVTAALFIGWALGHPAWGFLVVTVLLFVITGILYARSKSLDRKSGQETDWSTSADGRTGSTEGDSV